MALVVAVVAVSQACRVPQKRPVPLDGDGEEPVPEEHPFPHHLSETTNERNSLSLTSGCDPIGCHLVEVGHQICEYGAPSLVAVGGRQDSVH